MQAVQHYNSSEPPTTTRAEGSIFPL